MRSTSWSWTERWTMRRRNDVHRWPAVPAAEKTMPRSARSRSADGATIAALLPPSSRIERAKRPATTGATRRPIAVEPVAETIGTASWATSAAPTSAPPSTTWLRWSGAPVSAAARSNNAAAGERGDCGGSAPGSVGAVFGRDNDTRSLYVREVPPGLAAAGAGLLPGDQIVMIEGFYVRDLDAKAIRDKLRGEVGSTVALTVLRGRRGAPRARRPRRHAGSRGHSAEGNTVPRVKSPRPRDMGSGHEERDEALSSCSGPGR